MNYYVNDLTSLVSIQKTLVISDFLQGTMNIVPLALNDTNDGSENALQSKFSHLNH